MAVLAAAATIVFGIFPNPLFDAARDVGSSLAHLCCAHPLPLSA